MSTDIICKAVPGGLMASNAIESEKLDQFRGQEVMVKISRPRNLAFHRKYWSLIGVAHDMADVEMNKEQFRTLVTVGAGYCDYFKNNDGNMVAIPKSIKFASMSDDEFERLYQDSITFICQNFVLDRDQLDQIVRFM